jgi:transposase
MTPIDASVPDRKSAQPEAAETAAPKPADLEQASAELERLTQEALRLAQEKVRLESAVARLTELLAAKDVLLDKLAQAVKDLRALKFGKRSEKLPPGQLALAFEDIALTVASLEAQIEHVDDEAATLSGGPEPRNRRKREPGEARASLASHLPVVDDVIEPDSLECPCCKGALHRIGETIASRLDVIPVQYFIRRTIRPKYACRACEGEVVQAPAPAHVVEGGLPTEALVAQVLVDKHADHTPIYTQVQAMARQGVEIRRNVVAGWAGRGAGELKPVWRRMRDILLAGTHLFVDETEAPVLDPGRGRTFTGYFWAIAQDARSYGGKDPPVVVYTYAPGRGGEHARKLLASFTGVAQCDGYQVYKSLAAKRSDLQLAHCWAHCRRVFFKLLKDDGSTPLVSEALKRIAAFYAIEAEIKGRPPGERRSVRKMKTALLVADFHRWLLEVSARTMKGSDLHKAAGYALEHWDGLTLFLDDGRIDIDSNAVERAMRPVCLTRKNSLFAGSHGGAENWAVVASLIETCKLNDVNPQAYLTDVLTKVVNGHPNSRIDELMPWAWKAQTLAAKAAA